jgi:hypothetical protein
MLITFDHFHDMDLEELSTSGHENQDNEEGDVALRYPSRE